LEDYQKTRIVPPLNLEAAIKVLPLGEGGLDVFSLEFFREPSQRQDARNRGGKARERSGHVKLETSGCDVAKTTIRRAAVSTTLGGWTDAEHDSLNEELEIPVEKGGLRKRFQRRE
jgi:hypothetical protein